MKENMINRIPLKVYRYLRWRKGVRKTYRYNERFFSKEYAELCLDTAKAEWQDRSQEEILQAYKKKDDYVIRYLEALCGDVIEEYRNNEKPVACQQVEKKIWVFWWTGEDSAPDIVKACIKSIRRNANGHEVVMLNKDNFAKYVSLPEEILKKHSQGIIGHAHFSDIVRLSLLSEYGGVWIDATVFLSQPVPDAVFDSDFYTLKTVDKTATYYSQSRWCGYFLGGSGSFALFPFVRDCLVAHWKKTDAVIDYLIMDYLFGIACDRLAGVKEAMDNLPDNNFKRGQLMNAINAPYSKALFDSLACEETFASKLSWRYGNPVPQTKDGKLTNYGYLLSL